MQQTYCRAFEKLATIRGEASLFGWMCQICRNAIADLRRHASTWRPSSERRPYATIGTFLEALSAPLADEPESQVSRMELIRLIQSTLDCLPSHYGDVLEWKYIDGLALEEIATRLELGSKATESLLGRARGAFREAMALVQDRATICPNG